MDTDDGLKWFGEGFDGFPKKLPEDVVEYIIFIIDQRAASGISAGLARFEEKVLERVYLAAR
jgi:hypothetical protein